MIEIIFEAHGTTFDNEAKLASGFNDVALSPLGEGRSRDMGKRHETEIFDAIFCSDLQRSYKCAEIAFGNKYPIIKDSRLRECDYGDLTQHPREEVESEKIKRIKIPFPNGESYEQTTARMKDFLNSLFEKYNNKKVLIIGHRATQYGLDHLINGIPLEQLVSAKFIWQPGWKYELRGFTSK
ncbi:MAG: histidine phosphatase family protein [Candidatus Paceibacterota bacterium]